VTKANGTSNATTTTYAYDNAGRKIQETDALDHTTTYTYDAAGNLSAISGVKGNITYGYDNARNQVSVTDANGNTTTYQYDGRKRLTVTTFADSTTKINAYDCPGNLISSTDQAGKVVQYTYDAANQLQTVVQTNSPNTSHNTNTYGYDNDGNLASSSDENIHITATTFDQLYELTAKTLPDGSLTESRSYDSNGNMVSLTHFSGKTTTYTYDALNRLLTRAPDPTLNEPTVTFTYTATGKRATMSDASGRTPSAESKWVLLRISAQFARMLRHLPCGHDQEGRCWAIRAVMESLSWVVSWSALRMERPVVGMGVPMTSLRGWRWGSW